MEMKSEYTVFVGDINQLNAELKKASHEGKKPILMNLESYVESGPLKRRLTTYSVIFEQTVLAK